jgi:hypothetical protein
LEAGWLGARGVHSLSITPIVERYRKLSAVPVQLIQKMTVSAAAYAYQRLRNWRGGLAMEARHLASHSGSSMNQQIERL